jgi:hypothetical protein
MIAASAVWFFAYLYPALGIGMLKLFPTRLLVITTVWGAVEIAVAGIAGAWAYTEA